MKRSAFSETQVAFILKAGEGRRADCRGVNAGAKFHHGCRLSIGPLERFSINLVHTQRR